MKSEYAMHKTIYLLTILSCFNMHTLAYAENPTRQPALEILLTDVESARQELKIPAVGMVLVDKDNIIWSGAFGTADLVSGKPVDNDTIFRIGSITKSFTSLATLSLVHEGKLSLEENVIDITPEISIKNPWRKTHPVQVKHLLEHTAGLTDLSREEFEYNEPLSLKQALDRSPERNIQWPPGLHHSYNNVGAGLLAWIIEKRSGKSFETYVEEQIFEPLGMTSASFYPDDKTMQQLATGYDSDGETPIPYWHMTFRAFGAINLKPADMAPFLKLLLNKGRYQDKQLFPTQVIKQMETPSTSLAAQNGLEYGYGMGTYAYLRNGHVFHGHGGDGDGYLARFGVNREAGMAYFIVINVFRGGDLKKIRQLVEDYIISNLPSSDYPSVTLSVADLSVFIGDYQSATWRFIPLPDSEPSHEQIKVIINDDELYLVNHRGKRKLVPVTRNHFRFNDEPVATMAFVRDEQGQLYLQGDIGNYKKILE